MLSLFRRRKHDPDKLLKHALGDFELPSFSGAVMRTLQFLRDPNVSSAKIARSIEINPGLVVRVLRTVNSAAFGMRRRIESISHAVTLLGRSKLESMVVAIAVRHRLPNQSTIGFHAERFWTAAARRASVARALAQLLHPQTQSEAFVAGLLQDMALPLLAKVRPKQYVPLLEHWHNDSESRLEVLEQGEFGWDHSAIGAGMSRRWQLPDVLSRSIDAHHPEEGGEHAVDPAIQLVSLIRETEVVPGVERLIETCRDDYNLAPDRVLGSVQGAFDEAGELAALLR